MEPPEPKKNVRVSDQRFWDYHYWPSKYSSMDVVARHENLVVPAKGEYTNFAGNVQIQATVIPTHVGRLLRTSGLLAQLRRELFWKPIVVGHDNNRQVGRIVRVSTETNALFDAIVVTADVNFDALPAYLQKEFNEKGTAGVSISAQFHDVDNSSWYSAEVEKLALKHDNPNANTQPYLDLLRYALAATPKSTVTVDHVGLVRVNAVPGSRVSTVVQASGEKTEECMPIGIHLTTNANPHQPNMSAETAEQPPAPAEATPPAPTDSAPADSAPTPSPYDPAALARATKTWQMFQNLNTQLAATVPQPALEEFKQTLLTDLGRTSLLEKMADPTAVMQAAIDARNAEEQLERAVYIIGASLPEGVRKRAESYPRMARLAFLEGAVSSLHSTATPTPTPTPAAKPTSDTPAQKQAADSLKRISVADVVSASKQAHKQALSVAASGEKKSDEESEIARKKREEWERTFDRMY